MNPELRKKIINRLKKLADRVGKPYVFSLEIINNILKEMESVKYVSQISSKNEKNDEPKRII